MAITASSIQTAYQLSVADYNTRYEARIYLKVNSQSVINNTSNITVWWTMKKVASENYNAYCLTSSSKVSLSIGGSTDISSGTVAAWDLRTASIGTEITLYSRTLTITHESDGAKTIAVSGYHDPGNSWSNLNLLSVNVSLPRIVRASSISINKTSLTMDGSTGVTVSITRAVNYYTHKVTFALESYSQSYSGVSTSKSFTVPKSWNNALPNNDCGVMKVTVDTYNGSTKIGTATSNVTVYVPSDIVPSMASFTATRVDGSVPALWNVYVQGKSKVTLDIGDCAGSYGSVITSYKITGDGNTSTNQSFTTAFLNSSGTITFTAKATDSRNRTATKTVNISVQEYSPPKATATSVVERCNSSGTLTNNGTYVCIIPKYTYSSISGKNSFSVKARYKSSSTWSSFVNLNNNLSNIVGGSVDIQNNYTVEITVSDYFGSIVQNFIVPMFYSSIDVYKTGKGVAIGTVATQENLFEVNMPAKFNSGIDGYKKSQAGVTMMSGAAQTKVSKHVTFSPPFSSVPSVFVTLETSYTNSFNVGATNTTVNGFDICLYKDMASPINIQWLAIERT